MLQTALLALAFGTQAGDVLADPSLAKAVTFTSRAANAVSVVSALGQAAGAPLAAAQKMNTEVLIVRLDKVPLREAMRRIALATGGSWTLDHGTFYLGRTDAEETRRQLSARADEFVALKKLISTAKTHIAEGKPYDDATATRFSTELKAYTSARRNDPNARYQLSEIRDFTNRMPMGILKDSVLAQVDPAVLLETPPGRRTVFSTDADAMELPLKVDVNDAVQSFVKAQRLLAGKMKSADPNDVSRAPTILQQINPVTASVLKLDLVIDRTQQMGPNMEIELIGSGGDILASTQFPIVPDPVMQDLNQFVAKAGETKLTVAPDELAEIEQIAASMGEVAKVQPLSATAADHMFKPEKYDPLATYVSSFYLQTAEVLGKNLVADVPDAYMMLGPVAAKMTVPTATSWLKLTSAIGNMIAPTKIDEKWIEIDGGVSAPTNVLSLRANRRLLGDFYADVKTNGLTIGGLGRYAFESNQTDTDFMSLIKLGAFGANVENEHWQTLRLLGALLAHGGSVSEKGQVIPFRSLDRPTLDLLTEMIFYGQLNEGRRVEMRPGAASATLGQEVCDEMPQGLPLDGNLAVASQTEEAAYPDGPRIEAAPPAAIAWNTFMAAHPDKYPNPGAIGATTSGKFRLGSQQTVSLRIELTANEDFMLSYTIVRKPDGEAVPFNSLPATFKEQVRQRLAEYENQYK
jgi:hypothetical protein